MVFSERAVACMIEGWWISVGRAAYTIVTLLRCLHIISTKVYYFIHGFAIKAGAASASEVDSTYCVSPSGRPPITSSIPICPSLPRKLPIRHYYYCLASVPKITSDRRRVKKPPVSD